VGAVLTPTAKLEYCKFDKDYSRKNAEAFSRITMMLMDKYAREEEEKEEKEEKITVNPSLKWSELAVDFLSSTRTSAPDDLLKVDSLGM
jgi:hypothetical protein